MGVRMGVGVGLEVRTRTGLDCGSPRAVEGCAESRIGAATMPARVASSRAGGGTPREEVRKSRRIAEPG